MDWYARNTGTSNTFQRNARIQRVDSVPVQSAMENIG
jgi:hypothetical protein